MDRFGSFAVIVSLYSFWNVLLKERPSFMGYTRDQMLTYVLTVNLLRSFVLTGRGLQLVQEISSGKISPYLLRPINFHGYAFALDFAQKSVHVLAALVEIAILAALMKGAVFFPIEPAIWLGFLVTATLASLLFFFMEFSVSSLAFWTGGSGAPLFCFQLLAQFAAGAFFPIDVLPKAVRSVIAATPFPYLVYSPARILLGKVPGPEIIRVIAIDLAWLITFIAISLPVWRRGTRSYAAEGG